MTNEELLIWLVVLLVVLPMLAGSGGGGPRVRGYGKAPPKEYLDRIRRDAPQEETR